MRVRLTIPQLQIAIEFLSRLKTVDFNLSKVKPFSIQGQRVEITDGLNLLRSFPGLEGEQFKNDQYLANYLRKETNLEYILGGLETEQGLEIKEVLKKVVQEQPAPAETSVEQTQGGAAEQPTPVGTTQAPSEGMPFGVPSGPAISPVIHPAPRVPPPTPPKPEIIIANKSGMEVKPPSKTNLLVTDKSGNIKEVRTVTPSSSRVEVSKPPAASGSRLIIADKSGNIVREQSVGGPAITSKKPESPKIILANSSGAIKEPPPATPKTIFTANKSGVETGIHRVKPAPKFNFPAFRSKVGGGVAKFTSSALGKANPFLGRMGNQVIGGLTRIANPLGGGGAGSRSIFGRFSRGGGGRRFFGGSGGGSGKKVAGKGGFVRFMLAILASMMLVGFINITAPTSGTTPPAGGGTVPPPGGGGNINSCKFTRSGDTTKELTYKSPLLLSYIQEASNLTNIPPAVLAAFIRVESPSVVSFSDDQVKNYRCIRDGTGKNVSVTGALGVMQLQPEGTKGNDQGAIANGAKLIGKKYEELTEADYCDVRKNIIMGAGFILKKLSYKTSHYPTSYGDGTKWDPAWTSDKTAIEKLVDGYYGCIKYGSPDDENISCSDPLRIYSYGDDVWTSIQSCQAMPTIPAVPVPPVVTPPQKEFALSCPIDNGKVTSSSYFDSDYSNRHCDGVTYVSKDACQQFPATYFGVDIGTTRGDTEDSKNLVKIPTIAFPGSVDSKPLSCTLSSIQGPSCPASGCENQWILLFNCANPEMKNYITLQYHHINPKGNNGLLPVVGQTYASGSIIGRVARYNSSLRLLNLQIGINGACAGGTPNCVPNSPDTLCGLPSCIRPELYIQCPKL